MSSSTAPGVRLSAGCDVTAATMPLAMAMRALLPDRQLCRRPMQLLCDLADDVRHGLRRQVRAAALQQLRRAAQYLAGVHQSRLARELRLLLGRAEDGQLCDAQLQRCRQQMRWQLRRREISSAGCCEKLQQHFGAAPDQPCRGQLLSNPELCGLKEVRCHRRQRPGGGVADGVANVACEHGRGQVRRWPLGARPDGCGGIQ